ncbi:MAG: hypothetical protein PHH59_05460 [Methylovulum sp.]|uniref:protein YgfX n=1 Tax=Methylovulum sp. TaxID=1916980 RepID=UPI00261F0E75|nr:protein YgfX [Methylovulum sp.]MDD2723458.1 hypothetical protein [Methylovulum sp.]MDD5123924.1 hypothetical protein [Methylovulum sp.]
MKKAIENTVFSLSPSKRLQMCARIMHLLALYACLANALPLMVQCGVAIVVMVHYRLASTRCKFEWQTLRYTEAFGWEMAKSGEFVAVRLLPDTVITAFALFLHVEILDSRTHIKRSSIFGYNQTQNKPALLILPDSLAQDGFRALVVKLKTTYKIKSKSSNLLVKSG